MPLWAENHCVGLGIVAGLPQLDAGVTSSRYEKWHWSHPELGNCWVENEAGGLLSAPFFVFLSEFVSHGWEGRPWQNTLPPHHPDREQTGKGGFDVPAEAQGGEV